MAIDERAAKLADDVAAAADAWLTDPADAEVYRRLVAAVVAWRRYTRPMLDGLERAGRRSIGHGPAPVSEDLPGSPEEALDHLTGRRPAG